MSETQCDLCKQIFTGEGFFCGRGLCPFRGKASRDPLLIEREKTHGSFAKNAEVFNNLCRAIPDVFKGPQRMAMTMIFAKIARACQTPHVKDHWDDIAGYAKLGAEACNER